MPVSYDSAGEGSAVVFLHGWALTGRTYRRSLQGLADAGVHVYAPTLPGCGGTPDLPSVEQTLAGYADWVAEFITAAGVDTPVTLVGHSFGGGVAIRTAHDHPTLVARLVAINSIGGSAWRKRHGVWQSLAQRPLWDWGLHMQADVFPLRQAYRVIPVILADAVPNIVRSPRGVWRTARIASHANLTAELAELRRRDLPLVIVWGRDDKVMPMASLDAMRVALGGQGCVTVDGKHSWLIADPSAFVEVITNIVVPGEVDAPSLNPAGAVAVRA